MCLSVEHSDGQTNGIGVKIKPCAPSPPSRIFPGGVPPRTPQEKILGAVPGGSIGLGPITSDLSSTRSSLRA